jgi:hypothetical protein
MENETGILRNFTDGDRALLEIVFACMHSAWKRLRIRSWSYMWIMCVMRSVEEKDMGEVFCWRRI